MRHYRIILFVFGRLSDQEGHRISPGNIPVPRAEFREIIKTSIEYTSDLKEKTGTTRSRHAIKRAAIGLALALGIAAAVDYGYGYVTVGRYLEATDDAYVKADSTLISPKVSGYIAEVLVSDNEKVRDGQLLARIDDRDFKTALAQAQADLAASEAAVRNLDAQIELQKLVFVLL